MTQKRSSKPNNPNPSELEQGKIDTNEVQDDGFQPRI